MSLFTRCPSCATIFKVVPDQLKVSDGWVRCGQCSEVFDANAHLRPLGGVAAAAPASMDHAAAQTGAIDAGDAGDPEVSPPGMPVQADGGGRPEPVDQPIVLDFPEPDPHHQAVAGMSMPHRAPGAVEPPAVWMRRSPAARVVLHGETLPPRDPPPDAVAESPSDEPDRDDPADPYDEHEEHEEHHQRDADHAEGDVPSALLLQTADNDEPQQSLYQTAFVPPAPDAGTPEAKAESRRDEAAATLSELSFVRVAERRAFWQQPLVVAASLGVCLVLMSALLLQVVRVERDRLVAHLPGLQPVLEALCAPLVCEIAPLQQVDSVVIDSSAFNKVRGDLYQFDVEVRNTARTALAMPALELTLTDHQDLPLVRRVLTPADLRAGAVLAAGGAWSGSLPVQMVAPVAGSDRVAGYRVLAFYP